MQHRHGSSLQSPILPFYYVLRVEPGELPSRQQRDGRAERQQEPGIIGEEIAERVVMSALGHRQTKRPAWTLPPKADIERHDEHVRLVPKGDIRGYGQLHCALMFAALMIGHHFSISAF